MLKKAVSSVLALSMAAAPLTNASADTYMFRYKSPMMVSAQVPPEVDDTEYGVGNDIVAYFVAPIGYEFSKKIPVATHDVVEWRKDSGDIPAGIELDLSVGVFSGYPTAEEAEEALYHGYDASGNRIARARLHFTVFEPVGVPSKVDFYTHAGTYFYGEIPDPEGVTVHTWVPVEGVVYGPGMSMMNSAFQGTPPEAGTWGLAWRGYDYLDREVAFAVGDFMVADGPVVEELLKDGTVRDEIGSQIADRTLGESFDVTPTVQKALGPVTYKLIPETVRPAGLAFTSANGKLGGVYDDFETTASFRIEARDSYDGTTGLSNVFALTTLPASTDLSYLPNLYSYVGANYYKKLTARNLVPSAQWALVEGTLPDGIILNASTGELTGTPTKTETQTGLVFEVSGPGMITARNPTPIDFTIHSEGMEAKATPLYVRVNTAFQTDGVAVTKGASEGYTVVTETTSAPAALSLKSAPLSALSPELALDANTGVVSSAGIAAAGDYSQRLKIENATNSERYTTVWQVLRAFNPLKVTYEENYDAVRHSWMNKIPATAPDSVIGEDTFTIRDVDGEPLPDWLYFNKASGRISGEPKDPATNGIVYGPFVVTQKDAQDEIDSNPFTITVKDRAAIETSILGTKVERYVGNGYRLASVKNSFGGAVYDLTTKPGNWPSTLRLTADGWLYGRTTDPVGTVYSGLVVTASDGEGYSGASEPFDLKVIEADGLAVLYGGLDKTIEWTAGQPFTNSLPALRNGFGQVEYAFADPTGDVTITDPATGTISGNIPADGTYALDYTIDDDTERDPATGTLTLKINAAPETQAAPEYVLHRASLFNQIIPPVTGGTTPLTYTLQGTLPPGMSFNASTGRLYGVPTEEGDFPVTVTVNDKTKAAATSSFNLKVDKPLPFEISYAADPLYYGQTGASGILKRATVNNALASVVTWDQVADALPPGVKFATSSGYFYGTPTATGKWTVGVSATDGEGRQATTSVDLLVTRSGPVAFADVTFKHRKGVSFTDMAAATNVVAPVTYSSADPSGMPYGLVLNGATGAITGSFATEGTYTVDVTATDDHARADTATITFEIIGDLTVAAEGATLQQYVSASGTPPAVATNAVGAMTFAHAAGTLPTGMDVDPNSGALTGTPEQFGTFAGIVVRGTDIDGTFDDSDPFTIVVEPRAQLVVTAPATLALKRYGAADFVATATDAIPPVKYSVSPALPNGLVLDQDSGAISGSSEFLLADTPYTLTAVDSKGGDLGSSAAAFTLSVIEREALEIDGPGILAFKQHESGSAAFAATHAVGAASFAITPALPSGIDLDTTTGTISGTAAHALPDTVFRVSATDAKGGSLGTAFKDVTLAVAERDPLGISGPDSVTMNQYFSGEASYGAVNPIGTAVFAISPALPDGVELDAATGLISGTPDDMIEATTYTLTVADAHDIFDKTITLSVGPRLPLEVLPVAVTPPILGHEYSLALSADHVVGAVAWEHVSGNLPEGLVFDATSGTFSGTPTTYGETTTVTIRATDSFGGSDEETFSLAVGHDGSPITVRATGAMTRVGYPVTVSPRTENIVGEQDWTMEAGATGLVIDRKTGEVTGTPASVFKRDLTLQVTDATGRDGTAVITVEAVPAITVTIPTSIGLSFNGDVPVDTAAVATNAVGAVRWTISGTLPEGVTFDEDTGAFGGKPTETGTFGPITVTAADTLPGTTTSSAITINVGMNDDPIELRVADFATKIGYPIETAAPTYGNELGPVTFFSTDELASIGLSINPATGVLTGQAADLLDRYINVSIRDRDTTRVTSKPLHLRVLPPMQITLPAQVTISALTDITPIAPTRNYVVGTSVWNELDETANKLPQGIVFDTSTGTLKGNATEIGTFGPFTITSTDSLGDTGTSNSFVIKSNPGAYFIGLASTAMPDGVKRIESYSFDFKSLMTYVGMDESEIAWSLGAGSPPGLTISNGVLSGTPSLSGTYTFDVVASFENITAKQSYTIVVGVPETELELAAAPLPVAKRRLATADNSYAFDFKLLATMQNIPPENVVYSIEPLANGESLPDGLTLVNGVLRGTATSAAGTHAFRVTARFIDATDENVSVTTDYSIEVTDEIGFAFNGNGLDLAKKRLSYSFDLGSLIDPASLKGIAVGDLSWSLEVDPAAAPRQDVLPEGLKQMGSVISGTSLVSGDYPLLIKASFDGRDMSKAFTLQVGLQQIALALSAQGPADGELLVPYSADLKSLLTATNIPNSDVKWTSRPSTNLQTGETAGLPNGVTIKSDGMLSGTPAAKGAFRFEIKASWDDKKSAAEHAEDSKVYLLLINGATYTFKKVVAGNGHSCGITLSDGLKCWGYNSFGQLGTGYVGANNYSRIPTDVPALTSGVADVQVGQNYTCAVTTSGAAKCWGSNSSGQLGIGSTDNALVPTTVVGLSSGVASISAGYTSTCAVTNSGAAKCWGDGANGRLGNGDTADSTMPVEVAGLSSGVSKVSVGYFNACAITVSGGVKCWGSNSSGQLGSAVGTAGSAVPVDISGLPSGVSEVTVGNSIIYAVTSSGMAKTWGYVNNAKTTSPVDVPGFSSNVRSISTGINQRFSCGVTTAGAVKCWGPNGYGQLGNGTNADSPTPVGVVGLSSGVASVSAGYTHTCALMTTGAAKCWGNNSTYGKLGNNSTVDTNTPVDVGG